MSNVEIYGRVRQGKLHLESFPKKDVILIKQRKNNHVFNLKNVGLRVLPMMKFLILCLILLMDIKAIWLAFGYTGSGKTYTINSLIKNLFKKFTNCEIKCSCYQIYNKNIYDVLA